MNLAIQAIGYARDMCPRAATERAVAADVAPASVATIAEKSLDDATLDLHIEFPKQDRTRALEFDAAFNPKAKFNLADSSIVDAGANAGANANANANDRAIGPVQGMNKEALILGLNYLGQRSALAGCIADADNWKDYLVKQCGVDAFLYMTDRTHIQPKHDYIIKAIRYMVARMKKTGGTFFFTYSGHGTQVRNTGNDAEADGKDEALCPVDYSQSGMITDDVLFELITKELSTCPKNVRCISIMDACHSNTMFDGSVAYDVVNGKIVETIVRTPDRMLASNVVCLSGCRENQTSSDVRANGRAYGAMSNAALGVLRRRSGKATWRQLILETNRALSKFSQVACLSSERPLDLDELIDW